MHRAATLRSSFFWLLLLALVTVSASNASTEAPAEWACEPGSLVLKADLERPHWTGWGVDLDNSRFQPGEQAALKAANLADLEVRWAWGFSAATTIGSQAAVVGDRIFLGSPEKEVLSLDAKTGCVHWQFLTMGAVRATPSLFQEGEALRLVVADRQGYVYSLDASTGDLLWKTRADDHRDAAVTASPVVYGGVVYVGVSSIEEAQGLDPMYQCCTFRGSVVALDQRTGKKIWKTYVVREEAKPTWVDARGVQRYGPSGAGIWSAPTLDRKAGALYVTTGDAYSRPAADTSDAILALDLETGAIRWAVQTTADDVYTLACNTRHVDPDERCGPDFDYGASAILRELSDGRRILLAGQKSGMLYALDPDQNGKLLWQRRVAEGGVLGGIEWGFATDRHTAYVPISDVWTKTPEEAGGVYAVRIRDGKVLWHQPAPDTGRHRGGSSGAQPQAATLTPEVLFAGSFDGHLRGYDPATGEILWDFDTVRDFETVNDVRAKGGSLNGGGVTVVDGWIYFSSGYDIYGIPGNVFIAMGPPDTSSN